MELILAFAFVAVVAYLLINRKPKQFEELIVKTEEKVEAAVKQEVAKVEAVAKETVAVVKEEVAKVETVAKETVKRGRKKKA